jgi:site-specific recombinase XerD
MTAQSIYNALAKRARLAGIRDVTPHDGRRSFISNLLNAGADIANVQQLAGHSSIQTAARYDRRGEQAKAHAAALGSLTGAVA